jgi:hypothetical protein
MVYCIESGARVMRAREKIWLVVSGRERISLISPVPSVKAQWGEKC